MNPPYSRTKMKLFIEKAYYEITNNPQCKIIVGVLPVRTCTQWFHNWIYHKAEIRFLKGRVKFCYNGQQATKADFYSTMIIIWRK